MTLNILTWGLFLIIGLFVALAYKTIRRFWEYADEIERLKNERDALDLELRKRKNAGRDLIAALAENRTLKQELARLHKRG
jgi:UTP:GlnB (protein PII) uridylyltransferase